jgi:hypothetical protein
MTDKNSFYKEYPNFDWLYYHKNQLHFNIEKDENKVIEHFLKIGKNKKVLYNKNNYYNNFELDNINIGEISKGFDWEYYFKINGDLNKLFETKHETYNHYIKFGINEKRIKNILEKYEIKQLRTSDCMTHFKDRFKDFYKLKEYEDENINTVYFGVYSTTDINNIKNMKNTKYIIFGGTDVDLILGNKELKKLFDEIDNKIILYISENINDRLKYYGYKDAIKFNLDLTDKNIFKKPEILGDSIFIYNGFSKGLEHLYGKDTYEEIIKRNPNFNYIFSNNLNVKNEEMYNIYKKCFIGLRLTASDGNANMVKEMECMEIPVIHNHSNYGLKWKTVVDVENLIHKNNNINYMENQIIEIEKLNDKKILINTHTFLDNMAGDSIMIMNYMNMLMKNNNYITLLSKYEVSNNFTRNLNFDKYKIISVKTNEEIINIIDKEEINNNVIFIRNHEILENLKNKNWLYKTILYCLDINLEGIKQLNNQFNSIITQSEKLKKLFIDNNINENKVIVKEPLVYKYDFDLSERTDNEIRLIYCGTLRDEENILEIIEEFQKIHKERPEVVLKIVYGKIHGDANFIDGINKIIKEGVDGCEFKYNLSHRDACYEITTSDIGICWRKNGWGDNGEVSTKVKEYEMYELIIENNISYYNLKRIINCKYLKIIKNLNIDNSLKYKLFDYDSCNKYDTIIKQKFKINFIIYTLSCFNLINDKRKGNTENELNVMCNLTKICDVYYNDVYINDLIYNGYINIDEVNKRLIEHKKKRNVYYEGGFKTTWPPYKFKSYEIFIPTQNYDYIFFRGDNREDSIKLFNLLPEPKIYSHLYNKEIYKNNIIGFQTDIYKFVINNNLLKYFSLDKSIYDNTENKIVPKYNFLRLQFIKNDKIDINNILETFIDLKKKLNSKYIIIISGLISQADAPLFENFQIISRVRTKFPNLNIQLIITANEIAENIDYINDINWVHLYKNVDYKNYIFIMKQCDLCINNWNKNIEINGCNKNLDCILTLTPFICLYCIPFQNIMNDCDYDYPLFIKNNIEKEYKLENVIKNKSIGNSIIEKFKQVKESYNNNITNMYYIQMLQLKIIKKKKILFSIFNLDNFIIDFINCLKLNYNLIIDNFINNNNINERISNLKEIDIIFCEWCSENAVWYSNNKLTNQKLIIRLHRYELFTIHFFNINWKNVDKIIFISDEIQNKAYYRIKYYYDLNENNFDGKYYLDNIYEYKNIKNVNKENLWEDFQSFIKNTGKVPSFKLINVSEYNNNNLLKNKSLVIYNYIKPECFNKTEKIIQSQYNIGIMGIVPKLKRVDIAIDILAELVKKNKKYKLFIISKYIDDKPWLKRDIEEVNYFKQIEEKIDKLNLRNNIIFETYTDNVSIWFSKISFLLGVSDIEGCHQSIAEGMACGTIPFIYGRALKEYKLNYLYPNKFCFFEDNINILCERIIKYSNNEKILNDLRNECILYSKSKFHFSIIHEQLLDCFN